MAVIEHAAVALGTAHSNVPGQAFSFAVSVEGARFPSFTASTEESGSLALSGTVSGLAGQAGHDAAKIWLQRWHDNGGVLEVDHFRFTYGQLLLTANAKGSLDSALRPQGRILLYLAGLESWGMAQKQERGEDLVMAARVLGARDEQLEGRPALGLELSAEQGLLWVGAVPIRELDPLVP